MCIRLGFLTYYILFENKCHSYCHSYSLSRLEGPWTAKRSLNNYVSNPRFITLPSGPQFSPPQNGGRKIICCIKLVVCKLWLQNLLFYRVASLNFIFCIFSYLNNNLQNIFKHVHFKSFKLS